jgi:transposase-like protein
MTGRRKRHSVASKPEVAPRATKQARIVAELAKDFQVVHPVQISQWRGS